jgi:hypothetical protein
MIASDGTDVRNPLGSTDTDDVQISFDPTQPEVNLFFRFYMDDFGVYGRLWLQEDEEHKEFIDVPNPWTVPSNALIPYYWDPGGELDLWLATGGGKGEGWQMYHASVEGYNPNFPLTEFTWGSNGVAGTNPRMVVDDICVITGGWC